MLLCYFLNLKRFLFKINQTKYDKKPCSLFQKEIQIPVLVTFFFLSPYKCSDANSIALCNNNYNPIEFKHYERPQKKTRIRKNFFFFLI